VTSRVRLAGCALVTTLAVTGCSSGSRHGADVPSEASSPSPSPSASPSASATASGATSSDRAGSLPSVSAHVLPWRLPTPLSRAVALRYRAGALVVGGLLPGDHSSDRTLQVSLATGVTGRSGNLTTPDHDSAGALLSGRPMLVGGGGATELSAVQQLTAAGRWQVVGRLPQPRSDLAVVPVGARLVVVGGYDGSATPTSVLATRDGRRFHTLGHLHHGVRYAGVVLLGRYLWVLGGEVDGHELDGVQRVDLRTGAVTDAGRLPVPLGHEAVAAVGGRVLVMGGRTAPGTVSDVMRWFDPRTGRWTPAGRLPYPVADAAVLATATGVFLFGGETPAFTARVVRVRSTR
jgi:hypothetical protein